MDNNHDFGSEKKKHGFLIPFLMFFVRIVTETRVLLRTDINLQILVFP